MGASTKNEPDGAGPNSEPRILVAAVRTRKVRPRHRDCGRLGGLREQLRFTASTVGYCLSHPSPANRGGVIFQGMPIDRNAFFARTMHTPDWPERAELRAALRELSKALLPLHRALIDAARDDYAFGYGKPVVSPAQLIQLITDDPFFAWLKPMTALIVEIDEMARTDFGVSDARAIAARVEQLFDPAFNERYLPLLQQNVDVAIAHAAIRAALQKLTQSTP